MKKSEIEAALAWVCENEVTINTHARVEGHEGLYVEVRLPGRPAPARHLLTGDQRTDTDGLLRAIDRVAEYQRARI
jgi:hypothetical protein